MYECVPSTQEYTVYVPSVTAVAKTGTRTKLVYDTVTENVPYTECYTVMVPYTYTVKVPVCCGGCK